MPPRVWQSQSCNNWRMILEARELKQRDLVLWGTSLTNWYEHSDGHSGRVQELSTCSFPVTDFYLCLGRVKQGLLPREAQDLGLQGFRLWQQRRPWLFFVCWQTVLFRKIELRCCKHLLITGGKIPAGQRDKIDPAGGAAIQDPAAEAYGAGMNPEWTAGSFTEQNTKKKKKQQNTRYGLLDDLWQN